MGRPIDIQAAADVVDFECGEWKGLAKTIIGKLDALPSAQPTLYGYDIRHLAFVASIMAREGVSPEEAVAIFRDVNRVIEMMLEDMKEMQEKALEQWEGAKDGIAEETEKEV